MEIERINETTIKFYITYTDIEMRGFDKEEIWYSRERGEELFFEMMNEVNDQDQFEMNGPLWVQVQALEKGLEVIVTRGQMNDGSVRLDIPVEESADDQSVDNNIVDMLDQQFGDDSSTAAKEGVLSAVIEFADFEDVISLSHQIDDSVQSSLYFFENTYFVYIVLDEKFSDEEQDNLLSRVLEYGKESDVTIHRIQEYGKTILEKDALPTIQNNFN
ncbi:adaptor protein MecA [Salisediminibacterium halotolerans]|uniref:Adapter protein MecA n=1 Tax=Salisediminibacterium halotolerans TaxID=517425 RepID=A0A1H9VEJ6_9BACI|nr:MULTISPECIES: adaptor protein MecA [Salisediminibacterium]RLJ74442.1 adapter protein MecA 1/2 [Actinophytocola xinjiangensis]RPE87465.1 adapter protein MecA 1/2 [Salisediminibacterium halotolerans]TWG35278.1 adapter protein MecA 1/2 [Salisediminibacterium halotolerans]SES19874.1 adapter protein MecA 1/2 [Salisediminibacterium haloalkalitolerans]GEL06759.1 adapter protein MecA [Salisediminibacterium halotolerans]